MKTLILVVMLVILSLSAFATDVNDLALFSADWLKTGEDIVDVTNDYDSSGNVDFVDFAMFANLWEGYTPPPVSNQAPVAADANAWFTPYVTSDVTLSATDDGLPHGAIIYIVVSLPEHGYLQDPLSQNPIILAGKLPYILYGGGNKLKYLADTNTPASFTYKVWDGPGGFYSNIATVTLMPYDVSPYVSIVNSGYITADSNDYQNLKSGWGIQTIFKTRACDGVLLQKQDENGVGWDLKVVQGRLRFGCYGTNGENVSATSETRVNTGDWIYCSVAVKETASPRGAMDIQFADVYSGENYFADYVQFDVPGLLDPNTYVCDANIVFVPQYDGSIARTRVFSGVDPTDDWHWGLSNSPTWIPRDQLDETNGFAGSISVLRWNMLDGTGDTIVEDKKGLNALIVDGETSKWQEPLRVYYSQPLDRGSFRDTYEGVAGDCDCDAAYQQPGKQSKALAARTRKLNIE